MAVRVGGQVGKAQLSHPRDQGTLPRQSTSCKDQGAEAELGLDAAWFGADGERLSA